MDRYYTSIPLAKRLYAKNITYIGTNQMNRKGLLTELKEKEGREENSLISCREQGRPVILNSYVVKTKSSGMRNVLLVTTTEPAHYVANDEKTKPYIYKIYDFTKGDSDIPEQRMGSLTCKQKT